MSDLLRAWARALPALAFAFLTVGALAQPAPTPLRVLIFSGMNNHDWRQTTPALKKIYEDSGRFVVDVTEDPSSYEAEALDQYDLVVSNWTNFPREDRVWGPDTEGALMDFVRRGKGFVVFHAAAACFPTWPEYQQLIGASWARGTTGHGAIHSFEVRIVDKAHPITRGMADFTIRDELWHRMAIQPTARVLCSAESAKDKGGSGESEPVALATRPGKGRCFNLVLGHDVAAMTSYGWRLLMLRGSEWAATGKATISTPFDIGVALDAIADYEHYQSREPLAAVELLVQHAATDPALRPQVAAKMAERLGSQATDDCKGFLLEQLSLIGSAQQVPALAALASHESLGSLARAALERIPGKGASAALRRAMRELEGAELVGVINSLGQRRDTPSVPAIAALLSSTDHAVVEAAADALGKIGGRGAVEALLRLPAESAGAGRLAAADALLKCADRLLAAGSRERAVTIYEHLSAPDQSAHVRAAAFVGLASCAGDKAAELLLGALHGADSALHAAAARCIRTLGDGDLAKRIADELTTFESAVQAQVIHAFRDRGDPAVVPAVAEVVASDSPEVRIAAVRALGRLGDASTASVLIQALREGPSDGERTEIENALAGICRRCGGEAFPFTALDVSAESASVRASLFRVLAMVGDSKALGLLRASLRDPSAEKRLAAISALSEWPDGSPLADLLAVARASDDAAEKGLALRGVAALAPKARETPETTVAMISQSLALAEAVEEKGLLLGSLGSFAHVEAFQLAAASIEDESVRKEACLAAIQIAEKLPGSYKGQVQPVMERIVAVGKPKRVQTLAKRVLWALGVPIEVTRSAKLDDPGQNLALGATATSPDDLDRDGAASGDQAAIDGDPATYWDEVDNRSLYRLVVTFEAPKVVSAIRIIGYQHHNYAPRDFEIRCDGKVVETVADAWYESNEFAVTFPATRCASLELRITGYYGASPAIRELEVYHAGSEGATQQ